MTQLTAALLRKILRNAAFRVAVLSGCAIANGCGSSDDVSASRLKAQPGEAGFMSGGGGSTDVGAGTETGGTTNTVGAGGQNNNGGASGSLSGGTFGATTGGSGTWGTSSVGGAGGSVSAQGGSSGATAGGNSGAGGAPDLCKGAASRYCDDGNHCTVDSCDPGSGCLHVAATDDTPCDDQDVCTRGDHCRKGACVGQFAAQKAEVLGELSTIGGYEELESHAILPIQGLSVALTENLAVFAEPRAPGMRLALVRVGPSNLQVLDSVFTYASLVQSNNMGLWSPSSGTHFVRLSSTRIAVITTRHDIEIYDAVGDKLVFRAYRYLLEDAIGDAFVFDAKGRGDSLWVMTPMQLTGYGVDPDGVISTRTQFSVMDSAARFAIGDDANSLYVGGQGGIYRIDVSDPLHPVTATSPAIPGVTSRRTYHLAVRNGYLLLHEEVVFGTPGDVRVFRVADWKEVATIPSSSLLEPSFTAPTGATFVNDGLLMQRIHYDGDGKPSELTAELYSLDDTGAVLTDQWKYRDLAALGNTDQWQPLAPVAAGRLAIIGPTRRLLWTAGGKISELKGSQQGSLDQVLPGSAGRVFAYGSESTHLIDISNPRVPAVIAGGLLAPGESSLIRIAVPRNETDSPSLLNATPASLGTLDGRWRLGNGRVTQFESSDTIAPRVAGYFSLPGGTFQTVSQGLVFQLTGESDGTWLLKTFDLPRSGQQGALLSPIETQTLVGRASATPNARIAADASAHALVIASADMAKSTTVVDWFTRNDGHWVLAGSVQVPARDDCQVAVRGDIAVVVGRGGTGDSVSLVEVASGTVQVRRTRELPSLDGLTFAGAVLGLDGARVFVAMRETDAPMNSYHIVVHSLDLATLETVDRYQLPEIPGSMTVADDHLVFGARTSLTIANPGCSATQP